MHRSNSSHTSMKLNKQSEAIPLRWNAKLVKKLKFSRPTMGESTHQSLYYNFPVHLNSIKSKQSIKGERDIEN